MARKYKTSAVESLMVCLLVGGCHTAPKQTVIDVPKKIELDIAQAGNEKFARFIYCDVRDCPLPTVKNLAGDEPIIKVVSKKTERNASTANSIDLAFPFNSSVISPDQRNQLVEKVARNRNAPEVQIIARSDFVGPKQGQTKIVNQRAKVLRVIVAKQAPDAKISVRHEIADPQVVNAEEQAMQRRGTVSFKPVVTQKGELK